MTTVRIDRRYRGPSGSANGGVAAGLLAEHVDAPVVEVTLRRPPPLDVDLEVRDGRLLAGDVLVAQAEPGTVDLDPGPVVSLAAAREAAARFAGRTDHPFQECFVCGSDREPPDSLGLRPGRVAPGAVAAPWTPPSSDRLLVWAALDCPGGWSSDEPGRAMVLGRMALRLDRLPVAGEPHVVTGWVVSVDGRKTTTGSALRDADGALLALARSVWLTVDPRQVGPGAG